MASFATDSKLAVAAMRLTNAQMCMIIEGDKPFKLHKGDGMLHPWDFHPALTESRLQQISATLLDVLYNTALELDSPLDDAYTRGSTTFGRQRNAIIQLCLSGTLPWLKLTHSGMDVTFEIEGVPCRFFADDPENPKKPGYWRRNDADQLFPARPGAPVVHRFIVEKPISADAEAEVHFVGYDEAQIEVFHWHYTVGVPTMAAVDDSRPQEVELPPARAKLLRLPQANDQAAGDDTHVEG